MTTRPPQDFLPLSSQEFHILLSLADRDRHGYAIMQDVLEQSSGKVRLWPATLYGSLKRLIENGLIVESGARPASTFEEIDPIRRSRGPRKRLDTPYPPFLR